MAQKPANTAEPAPAESPTDVLDRAAEENVPATTGNFIPGQIVTDDEFVLSPKEFPILKIASDMGKMKTDFDLGQVGFMNPEVFVLAEAGEKFDLLVVGVKSYWKEFRKYVPNDQRPLKTYTSRQAAIAAGELIEYVNVLPRGRHPDDKPPTVKEAADLLLLVAIPDGRFTTAPIVRVLGRNWIPVRYYADRNFYEPAARPIVRANHGPVLSGVGGYTGALWTGNSAPHVTGDYTIQVLQISLQRLLEEAEATEYRAALSQFGLQS